MLSIAANRPSAGTLHSPQQRPSGDNSSSSAPAHRSPAKIHRNSFKNTCRNSDMRGQMCFHDFSCVRVEVGWVLPGLPPRTEGGCDWRRPGIPPASIGTEAYRGSEEEGLKGWYLPPPFPPQTHTHLGIT
ncbi:hypothetical protein CgunFtcFv8_026641 [Champsocephalus gunnari]|uniref:Uncharacterized protein n=1 Tax=Champsocephalus gunnari TaxID=52237 RepID=A0AAN8E2K4_CHAGU|nr:hypothetical protein CgunFtcFv8_026641 [Champsocephalus gunnari]